MKKRQFYQTVILNINSLKQQLEKFKPITSRFFFRGVSNSSYKIYSSMQRCWFIRKEKGQNISMQELSDEIFRRFNNSAILIDAFNKEVAHPSNISNLAKWSFIQHFGGPSHFVDFTPDINSALFFSLPKSEEEGFSSNETDLNNYISIYIYPDNPMQNGNLNTMYESSSKKGRDLLSESIEKYPNYVINTSDVDQQMFTQPLDNKFWGASIYGEEMFKIVLPGDGSVNDMNLSNSHISKQKGNFFLGNIEDCIPLKYAPKLRCKNWDQMENEYYVPYGCCLDIHKSLIPEIKATFSIPTKEEIYTPDSYIREAKSELQSLWNPENK